MRSTGEKVILIIGAGVALAVTAISLSWVIRGEILDASGGWFAYSPDQGPTFVDASSERAWAAVSTVLIWLVAISVWVAISVGIWRGPRAPGEPPRSFLERMRDRSG